MKKATALQMRIDARARLVRKAQAWIQENKKRGDDPAAKGEAAGRKDNARVARHGPLVAQLIAAAEYARDNACGGSAPTERNAWQHLNDALTDLERA